MKKSGVFLGICASMLFFINATVWEGAAAVASGGELPETGLYIATNSFPANTVVDLTNLENGRTIRAIASSTLDSPGLLALLSKDAANAIGLQSRTLGRISMSLPADPVAFPRFNEGTAASGDPDFNPAAFAALNSYNPSLAEIWKNSGNEEPENMRVEGGELIVDMPDDSAPVSKPIVIAMPVIKDEDIIPERGPQLSELTFIPTEARPPEKTPEPPLVIAEASVIQENFNSDYLDPSLFIDPVGESNVVEPNFGEPVVVAWQAPEELPLPVEPVNDFYMDPSLFVAPVGEMTPVVWQEPEELPNLAVQAEPITIPSIFSAPLISDLEKGKYYLQLGAFSKEETVRSELLKIENNLPVAIMNAGDNDKPIYRILVGPLNLGESGALLQRFKGSHKDAFVRHTN